MRPPLAWLVLLISLLVATGARADDAADVVQARADFVRGAEFIKSLQYADALAAFERSAKAHPHAATTYNIAACLRAMGRYTLARKRLDEALARDVTTGQTELSETLRTESHAFIDQIEQLLAHAEVSLTTADAAVAVDGHPLEVLPRSAPYHPTLLAGTRPPGPGEVPPAAVFTLVLDPGAHVITLTRRGFADGVVNQVFSPGSSTKLNLELDRLPATLHFASSQDGAEVAVNAIDVGVTPVDIQRPAGQYHVLVRKSGFVSYEADLAAHPGERVDLMANLKPYSAPLTKRWWFWTAAAVVVGGVVVGTYEATRPAPQRPALNGGGLGWTLQTQP